MAATRFHIVRGKESGSLVKSHNDDNEGGIEGVVVVASCLGQGSIVKVS